MRTIVATTAVLAATVPLSLPAHAGGMCHLEPTQESVALVTVDHACFTPVVNKVAAGSTVTWLNETDEEHNLTGGAEVFGIHDLRPRTPVRILFKAAGTYPYSCTFHVGMTGVVIVGDGGAGVTPAAFVLPSPDPTPSPAPSAALDTVRLSSSDGGWAENPAAVGGAGAGVLGLGLVVGFAAARRPGRLSDRAG